MARVVSNSASGNQNHKMISKASGEANRAESIDSVIQRDLQYENGGTHIL